jgi:hypothetical protein
VLVLLGQLEFLALTVPPERRGPEVLVPLEPQVLQALTAQPVLLVLKVQQAQQELAQLELQVPLVLEPLSPSVPMLQMYYLLV